MIMICDIKNSLHCRSTRDIQGLSLYFKPVIGSERRVFICASISDTECGNDSGVSYKLLTPTHAEIILPDHLRNENGTFRCVMRGALPPETQKCWWSPGADSQNGTSTVDAIIKKITEFNHGETTTFITEPESEDTSTKPIIGAVLGAIAAIILIIVVGYLLFRHFKSKRSPEDHGKCSMKNGYSKTEDDKNESTSVKINMDAGVGTIDENRRLADQT